MPLYEYRCEAGHVTTRLRPYEMRDEATECPVCGAPTLRLFPKPHIGPDGMYSYAPNIGDKDTFDRKQAKIEKWNEAKREGRQPKLIDEV